MYVYMGRVGCLITVSISSDHKIVELDPRVRFFDTIRVKAPRSADFKVYGSGGVGWGGYVSRCRCFHRLRQNGKIIQKCLIIHDNNIEYGLL